jgi:hypothetical protein
MGTKSKVPAYLISGTGIVTVYMNGKMYTAAPSHSAYAKIMKALKEKRWAKLPKLFDISAGIVKKGKKKLAVKDGQIFYGNEPVHNVVTNRILSFMKDGLDFKPLLNFLKRLLQNPSKNSVACLYRFMEANELPVTWDGYVVAYKKVTDDYKDFKTGTFDNSVGKTVEMPRQNVVDDPQESCGPGLHVGGLKYARLDFMSGQGRIVLVKVDPKDVVSVPVDYSSAKCRTCKYVVTDDFSKEESLTQTDVASSWGKSEYADEYDAEYEDEDDDDDDEEDTEAEEYPDDDEYENRNRPKYDDRNEPY